MPQVSSAGVTQIGDELQTTAIGETKAADG